MRFFSFRKQLSEEDKQLLDALYPIIGYRPVDLSLFRQALKHASSVEDNLNSNERLEYLGDSVLDMAVANFLYEEFPDRSEGFMTKMRAKLVSRQHLNKKAKELGITKLVVARLRKGDKSNSLGGNAFEALVGAVYLDKGYDFARSLLYEKLIGHTLDDKHLRNEVDFKSVLNEWGQKNQRQIGFETKETDPGKPEAGFTAILLIDGEPAAKGTGTSKKRAEQAAAQSVHMQLRKT